MQKLSRWYKRKGTKGVRAELQETLSKISWVLVQEMVFQKRYGILSPVEAKENARRIEVKRLNDLSEIEFMKEMEALANSTEKKVKEGEK